MENLGDEIVRLFTTVDNIVDIDQSNLTPIQEFYNNSTIFITGGTGFLGYLLLEKLLRSCPVSRIYVMVRQKKGKDLNTRMDEMFNDPVFQRIRNQFPETQSKVIPIEGDCTEPDLGLSDQDKQLLTEQVEIVFHIAATVRFDEKLKTAVFTNIRATRDLTRLACRMSRLKSFMHVSTVYANCINPVIEEDVYPSAGEYASLIILAESTPESILNEATPKLLGKYPNTYVYTKQIAESVVKQEGERLPLGIHRPSIVLATYKEPIRGWVNNLNGSTGVLVGGGFGVLRVLHGDSHAKSNIIPGDMCINSLVAAAWEVGEQFRKAQDEKSAYKVQVYNYESNNDKPISWMMTIRLAAKYGTPCPLKSCIWYSFLVVEKNEVLHDIFAFLLHTVPAYIFDTILICMGKPTKLLKIYSKINKFSSVIAFFCTNEWKLKSRNTRRLIESMVERDRRIFFSDMKKLDWEEYFKTYTIGTRVYTVKDPLSTLPEARRRYRRLYWAHQVTKTVVGALFLWLCWSLLTLLFRVLFL